MLKYVIFFILLVCTLSRLLSKRNVHKRQKRIIGAFNVFWCIALGISFFTFNGRYAISTEAYFCVILSVLSFNFGFKYSKENKFLNKEISNSANYFISSKLINTIIIISTFYIF